MHKKIYRYAGKEINSDRKVLIMVHGRGGSAEDILSLSAYLEVKDFSLMAPQAAGNTWYPYSFLAPPAQNEPWLTSALSLLFDTVQDLYAKGLSPEQIYFLGFSQGACLTLEFVARNAARYGGVVAFTGGLIGDRVNPENYKGDFGKTPIFLGTSDPDPHVPVERVHATGNILKAMNADISIKVYPGMGHTISPDEMDRANQLVFAPKPVKY